MGKSSPLPGKDITKYFQKGTKEVLKIAKMFGAKEAILKQRSPSCGNGQIYDGTFSKQVIKGDGITARLLKRMELKFYRKKIYKIMPELPEVETIRRQLLKEVVGKKNKGSGIAANQISVF